jgi:hypothetical protein
MRPWLSVACFVVALGLWGRSFWLLARLGGHRAVSRKPGQKRRLLRPAPGEYTTVGERLRRQILGLWGAALVFHALAAWL